MFRWRRFLAVALAIGFELREHSGSAVAVPRPVMRVLAEIALRHPQIEIPLVPILEVLEFPATTDRSKAAAIRAVTVPGHGRVHRRTFRDDRQARRHRHWVSMRARQVCLLTEECCREPAVPAADSSENET